MIGDYNRDIFTADSDIQRSMAQKINEKAESLDGEFAKMYGQIDSLGTHWVGEDYDMFLTGCEGYKTALSDLSASMKMYAGHFEKIATGTDELATTLIGIVQNMTTRNGTGGTGTQGSGTQGSGTGGGPVVNPNVQTPEQSNPGQTGDADKNVGGVLVDNGDSDKKVESGAGDKAETYNSVTLKSGDVVNVGGQNMRFYGAYSDPRGTSVNMYADNQGNLFFEDGSPVKLSRVAANGQTVYVNASLSNVGTYVTDSHGGHSWPSYWKMNDADGNIISESNLASSVTYEDDNQAPNLTTNDNMGALIENDNSITQGAKLKDSYVNASTNEVVNGHTVAVPSSMQGLNNFVVNGADVIRIDPQYKVQWDPSSGWGNGYDFDTSNGPVYLIKSEDGTYYNLCDEYGNIINDKHFTPDGFNVEYGSWK